MPHSADGRPDGRLFQELEVFVEEMYVACVVTRRISLHCFTDGHVYLTGDGGMDQRLFLKIVKKNSLVKVSAEQNFFAFIRKTQIQTFSVDVDVTPNAIIFE